MGNTASECGAIYSRGALAFFHCPSSLEANRATDIYTGRGGGWGGVLCCFRGLAAILS